MSRAKPVGGKAVAFDAMDVAMAKAFWFEGKSGFEAAVAAGYDPIYAQKRWQKILKSEQVKQALLVYSSQIKPQEIEKLAKARLHEKLVNPPEDERTALGYIRTGLEVEGALGGPSELHLHQHTHLPPQAEKMLLAKMKELEAIDAEIVSQGAAGQSQSPQDDERVQAGKPALGLEDRAAGQEPEPGDSNRA